MEVNGGELFEKMRKVWQQTKIIVSSADMVLEKPIVNMGNFLDQVESMMA